MSWVRGKEKSRPGTFFYECRDWSGNLFRAEGGFESHVQADRAGELAEREMTAAMNGAVASPSDSELLVDLLG